MRGKNHRAANTLAAVPRVSFYVFTRKYVNKLLVPYAAQRFIDNLPQVFAGTFNQALLEDASSFSRLLDL